MPHIRLGELLVQQGLITEKQLVQAIRAQEKEHGRIGEVLIKMGMLTEEELVVALATQMNIPYADKKNYPLNPQTDQGLEKAVPYEFAKTNLVLPLNRKGNVLTCAVADPLDLLMIDNLKMVTGCDIELIIASRTDLIESINHFYTLVRSHAIQSAQTLLRKSEMKKSKDIQGLQTKDDAISKLIEDAEEAPVIKLVDLIMRQAIEQRASDIHIEPYKEQVILRYRIDGALYKIPPPSRHLHPAIVSRLKIISKLDIAEKRLPQDGSISFSVDEKTVDLRISTVPTVWGEKVVLRILDKSATPLDLNSLGFESKQLDRVRHALKKPHGLFFVTGPTGSGKSTTLYAALQEIIDPKKNILTAEDPVEFKLEGINQVAIRPDIGLSFATALKAFLRQDPDIIMVGEVRDAETAQICVRAALTGHFVLSTLHTNDAPSAITRLLDIGVESYLLTPSLVCILAQRLARRLCPKCKEPIEPNPDLFGGIKFKSDLIYKAVGCEECNNTGYHGRTVISETMLVDDAMREMVSRKSSYGEIRDAARKLGMITLFEDGIKKVEEGITSFDEVVSVTTT